MRVSRNMDIWLVAYPVSSVSKYKILSVDGGGVRGILAARVLARLEAVVPGLLEATDLFAGTSTGAIIATGLAQGLSATALVDLYKQRSGEIFYQTLLHQVGDLWGLIGAKYCWQSRYNGLFPTFGDGTLAQLPKKLLVATFDLDSSHDLSDSNPRRWKARFFHNYNLQDPMCREKALDVVMRSSAAPTYFPIYQGYIDGGVVANNPSMCAMAAAINPQAGARKLDDIIMLSIGTGMKPQFVESMDGDWGLEQWGLKLIDLLLEAGPGLADYQCQQLLGSKYLRIDFVLPEAIGLDAADKIEDLMAIADATPLDDIAAWLKTHWAVPRRKTVDLPRPDSQSKAS
jgi:uncharacterized protein